MLFTLEKAIKFKSLQTENLNLRHKLSDTYDFGNMVADSSAMQQVLIMSQQVIDGHFREDLYYRLSVQPVTIPPAARQDGRYSRPGGSFYHTLQQ